MMMSLSKGWIFLVLCFGLAPNAISGPTDRRSPPTSVHYCKQYTVRPSLDYILCNCLDACDVAGTVFHLLDKELAGFVHGELAFSMYRCAVKCFDPDLSPLPLPQNKTIEFLLCDLIKEGKAQNLSETSIYEYLLSRGLQGPFKELVIALNETRIRASSITLNSLDLPQNLGKVCTDKFLRGMRELEDAERELEEILYCRLYINCIDNMVQFKATHLIGPIPSEQYWEYFKCARHAFYEANPVRSIESSSSTSPTTSISTQSSPITIRAVKCAATKPTSLLWLFCGLILILIVL